MLHFLIADDHAVSRQGLRQILLEAFPSAAIEEVTNGEDLLEKSLTQSWDVVISDISMPGRSGLEILQEVRLQHPKLPILMLSAYVEDHYAIRAFRGGASGYLNKEAASEELVKAINQLLLGRKYITMDLAEKLAGTLDRDAAKLPHELLTDREFEVLNFLASGKAVSRVAELMRLSVNTVSTYRARIMTKMNLTSNADLILYAKDSKLL